MRLPSFRISLTALCLLMLHLTAPTAQASVIGIGVGAFGPGSTLTTFTGLANGLEVNGLITDGILFNYSLGNGRLVIDGGPGTTNNVQPQNIVSAPGGNAGILTLTFPSSISSFGYGYAVLTTFSVANATTIDLFSGTTNVGSLSHNALPDPLFAGGFAGIQSTIPFNSARVTFNSTVGPAFAMDNIRTAGAIGVPEPSTFVLVAIGIGLLWSCRRTIKGGCSQ
jgi:hypothetical protein